MNLLPHWVLTNKFPAFYDSESKTAIEQTARIYGAMQELITEYNNFVDSVNQHIIDFNNDVEKNFELFTTEIRQEFDDFIRVVELKLDSQDKTIEDAFSYIKSNLSEAVKQIVDNMVESGDLDDVMLSALEGVPEALANEIQERKAADEAIIHAIDSITIAMTYNDETEALTMTAVLVEGSNDIIYTSSDERIDII